MNDRELLELAAKAAGIEWANHYSDPVALLIPTETPDVWADWNPLIDDGDALRLAASVCMEVTWCSALRHVTVKGFARGGIWINITERYQEGDLMKATRRAIVRAAAEIGRNK